MASRYLRQEHTIYLRGKKNLTRGRKTETTHAISQNVSSHIIKKAIFFTCVVADVKPRTAELTCNVSVLLVAIVLSTAAPWSGEKS